MAQMPSGPMRARPTNDLYTVLAAIALVAVLGTLGFVIYRCTQLLDVALPGIMTPPSL